MQINRLFEIIYLLLHKKTITAKELAERFEVSRRTILRDVEVLTAAGIPIYTSQGKGGGISILDSFVLNKTFISEEEQNQILFALQGLTVTQNMDAKNILGKLQGIFQKMDTNWIEVDFSRWGHRASDQAKFEMLREAITQKQALGFTYSNSQGETNDRKVYPCKLIFKAKSWYLQAFCVSNEAFRTFKINRMYNIQVLPEPFGRVSPPIPKIEEAEYPPFCLVEVMLRFLPRISYRVYDEFDEQDILKQEDGSLIVSMRLPEDDWLYHYILSFGECIEVLEPQRIRDELIRRVEKIKVQYE